MRAVFRQTCRASNFVFGISIFLFLITTFGIGIIHLGHVLEPYQNQLASVAWSAVFVTAISLAIGLLAACISTRLEAKKCSSLSSAVPQERLQRIDYSKDMKKFQEMRQYFQENACKGCRNWHGEIYFRSLLVCALHPYGPESGKNCRDWEKI
jgi:uncharacterized protein YacL